MEVKYPIRAFVINLEDRTDKFTSFLNRFHSFFNGDENIELVRFPAVDGIKLTDEELNRLDFDIDRNWIDPHFRRPLSTGEIGCFISHFRCWEWAVNNNQCVVIFEDDVEFKAFNFFHLTDALKENDLVYLGRKEMSPRTQFGRETSVPTAVIPGYSYWCCAYALTPEGAKKLIQTSIRGQIIPADEYVPLMYGEHPNQELKARFAEFKKLKAVAFEPQWVTPVQNAWDYSDTEYAYNPNNTRTRTFTGVNTSMKLVTVATELAKATDLIVSALHHGFERENIIVLGIDQPWQGGDITNGPGGGIKLIYLKELLDKLEPSDIVLFCDGYDTFICDNVQEIQTRFLGFNADVVFSAEKTCWPDQTLVADFDLLNSQAQYPTVFKYLNSGLYVGRVWALKELLNSSETLTPTSDDQLYLQRRFLEGKRNGKRYELDRECYLFQNVAGAEADIKINNINQIDNKTTSCTTTVLHGNGGDLQKAIFGKLKELLYIRYGINPVTKERVDGVPFNVSVGDVEFLRPIEMSVVAPEILQLSKFMTPESCARLIALAEKRQFKSLAYDNFPGQEVRLKDIDPALFDKLATALEEKVYGTVETFWFPLKIYGLRDAFIIKYEQGKQVKLDCHHDASLVSGIVKLNDGYEGGATTFYRQNYTTKGIPVGDLVMWPGAVTHGHEGSLVTSGTKYALVIWTSRYEGDVL